jgi:hypothetical protein
VLTLYRFLFSFLADIRSKSRNAPVFFLGQRLPSKNRWIELIKESRDKDAVEPIKPPKSALRVAALHRPLATVIVSLYRSEPYLKFFFEELDRQTVSSACEIVLVSSAPTVSEKFMIDDFASRRDHVKVVFVSSLIGIYEAWNLAIESSTAEFITNMNVDDSRNSRSIEIQISELLENPEIDVVYQDVYYSYTPNLTWDEIAKVGLRSQLPDVTLRLLATGTNAPHNAPMWRRSLHSRVGLFDPSLKSAGDHDFWIRSAILGARFRKSPFAHVSYYLNPDGMSTKAKSPGRTEGLSLLKKYRGHSTG